MNHNAYRLERRDAWTTGGVAENPFIIRHDVLPAFARLRSLIHHNGGAALRLGRSAERSIPRSTFAGFPSKMTLNRSTGIPVPQRFNSGALDSASGTGSGRILDREERQLLTFMRGRRQCPTIAVFHSSGQAPTGDQPIGYSFCSPKQIFTI